MQSCDCIWTIWLVNGHVTKNLAESRGYDWWNARTHNTVSVCACVITVYFPLSSPGDVNSPDHQNNPDDVNSPARIQESSPSKDPPPEPKSNTNVTSIRPKEKDLLIKVEEPPTTSDLRCSGPWPGYPSCKDKMEVSNVITDFTLACPTSNSHVILFSMM